MCSTVARATLNVALPLLYDQIEYRHIKCNYRMCLTSKCMSVHSLCMTEDTFLFLYIEDLKIYRKADLSTLK